MTDSFHGTHILSGSTSQCLRTFCSNAVWTQNDLDACARLLQTGPSSKIKADFEQRVSTTSPEVARALLASKTYGPGKIPLYNYLLQLVHLDPLSRKRYLSTIKYLAEEAGVPVDTPDLSGTTALMWSISTEPYLEPEVADILLKAGGNINHRNRYGCVAAHDAVMARDFTPDGKRKTCDAVKYFVDHGGDLNVKCGDGTTPRGIVTGAEVGSGAGQSGGGCGSRGWTGLRGVWDARWSAIDLWEVWCASVLR